MDFDSLLPSQSQKMATAQFIEEYRRDGFAISRQLFSQTEVDSFSKHFTEMVERGGDGWAEGGVDPESPDPLKRYPRLLQPHRGDKVALDFMLDQRLDDHLTAIAGASPYAVQTMVYFKPPGARGQNLHQDNNSLRVHPGTCLAAWLALDDCDEDNGCMMLVPGSQDLPIICQVEVEGLDSICWNSFETPLPPGSKLVPALMKRGDVLFFNGSIIHGSYQNNSETRFRRSLISHYVAAEAEQVARYYFPIWRMDGTMPGDDTLKESTGGGPCGVYQPTESGFTVVEQGVNQEVMSPH